MPRAQTTHPDAHRVLDALTAVLEASGRLDGHHGAEALLDARRRAARSFAAYDGQLAPELIGAPLAGSVLAALIGESELDGEPLSALVAELACAGVAPLALLRETLRAPALGGVEPAAAASIAVAALAACAPLRHVSLWSRDGVGSIVCSAHAGAGARSQAARRIARAAIAGEPARETPGGEMLSLAICRGGEPLAALVARSRRGARARVAACLQEASAPLAAILERGILLAGNAASERTLLASSERRLTRLGFDLHDGPLQELLLVAEDLALFRQQVAVVLEGRRGKELLGGRLDDLDARLISLEHGLRGISSSVHSAVLVTRPFRDAVRDLLDQFAARTGIEPELRCDGDLDSISTSQRLAVLSVVGEALNNVREHGNASAVAVAIALGREGLRAQVRDDGRGFDVERELLRAARSGHMGLAGMHERVRLLDGQCRVESSPGGPTEVTLALPLWLDPAIEAPLATGARPRPGRSL